MQQLSELPGYPWTRFTQWRLRSRACAIGDIVAAAAGAGLFVIAAVDSLASWPSNRVLLSEPGLARVAAVLLAPSWLWLFVSFPMVFGIPRRNPDRRRRSTTRATDRPIRGAPWSSLPIRFGLGLAAVVCVVVVVGGFIVGAAKGHTRVRPGQTYEVSTRDLNDYQWTPVTADQYALWQARFVREDGAFTFFGLALIGGSLVLLRLHRAATRRVPADDPSGPQP